MLSLTWRPQVDLGAHAQGAAGPLPLLQQLLLEEADREVEQGRRRRGCRHEGGGQPQARRKVDQGPALLARMLPANGTALSQHAALGPTSKYCMHFAQSCKMFGLNGLEQR